MGLIQVCGHCLAMEIIDQNHRLTNSAVKLYYISDQMSATYMPEEFLCSLFIPAVATLICFVSFCKNI